jgi:cytochrome c2
MNKRTVFLASILLFACLTILFLAACGSSQQTTTTSGGAPDGQTLMQERCSVCHSLDRVSSAHKTSDQWKTTVDRMISHGANLTSTEERTLVDYLAQNYK